MKLTITVNNFPMRLVDAMVADLKKHLDTFDVQVGGDSTVYITFYAEDITKIQVGCILVDKYRFGGDIDDDSFCSESRES